MKRKFLIIIIILLVVFSVLIFSFFIFHKGKNNNNTTNETKYIYPVKNIINNSAALAKDHCIRDFCIKNLIISYYYEGDSYIFADAVYNGSEITDICFKINFIISADDSHELKMCYLDLQPNDTRDLEIQFTQEHKHLSETVNYTLTEMSPEDAEIFKTELKAQME